MGFLVTSLIGCLALTQAYGQANAGLVAGSVRLKGAVINLYCANELDPAVVVRLDDAYNDYQTKGFFRIGVLPIGVMQGATFELRHPESMTNGLAQLQQWLGNKAGKRLDLRRVNFLVSVPETNRLEIGRACLSDGRLELFGGVRFVSGTNHLQAARGRLQIVGENAGQLILGSSPPTTNHLLGRIANPKPSDQAKLP